MNTAGGSESYRHKLVNYDSPMIYYDSGWYAWFYDMQDYRKLNSKIHVPPCINMPDRGSIQDTWMH